MPAEADGGQSKIKYEDYDGEAWKQGLCPDCLESHQEIYEEILRIDKSHRFEQKLCPLCAKNFCSFALKWCADCAKNEIEHCSNCGDLLSHQPPT